MHPENQGLKTLNSSKTLSSDGLPSVLRRSISFNGYGYRGTEGFTVPPLHHFQYLGDFYPVCRPHGPPRYTGSMVLVWTLWNSSTELPSPISATSISTRSTARLIIKLSHSAFVSTDLWTLGNWGWDSLYLRFWPINFNETLAVIFRWLRSSISSGVFRKKLIWSDISEISYILFLGAYRGRIIFTNFKDHHGTF